MPFSRAFFPVFSRDIFTSKVISFVAFLVLSALFFSPLSPFTIQQPAEAASLYSGTCEQSLATSSNVDVLDIYTNGKVTECRVKFTSGSNTWTVPQGVSSVKVLVVGGGGGGGTHVGGGGGGGAVYENLAYGVTPLSNVSITVGAGGAGAVASGIYCVSAWAYTGGTSTFGGTSVLGGGHGASWEWQYAGTGANGGGGSSSSFGQAWFDGAQGQASTGWSGYKGGNAPDRTITYSYGYPTGGGAGAASNGSDAQGLASGSGGEGKYSDITGTYFGGGGGGGFHGGLTDGRVTIAGSGGIGGGGAGNGSRDGTSPGKATSGAANTGGGGGGSGAPCANLSNAVYSEGGNGGSGVVIVQYSVPNPVNTERPSVAGSANVGSYLQASQGSWSNPITKLTYQWQASTDQSLWVDIVGATSNSYKLTSAEANKYMRVVVFATNQYGTQDATSVGTGLVSGTASDACAQTVTDSSTIEVTEIATSGGGIDCVVKFKSGSNTWTKPAGASNARVLVVGGGGSGGGGIGGGGGAGEVLEFSSYSLTQSSYSVSVGAGAYAYNWQRGVAGGDTVFGSYTAYGGGGGGYNENIGPSPSGGSAPYYYGSQGGGGYPNTWSSVAQNNASVSTALIGSASRSVSGATTYRHNGGVGSSGGGDYATSGGGGGAGADGAAGMYNTQSGGDGGAGMSSDITGVAQMYAAGGGGGVNGHSGALSRGIPGNGGSAIGGAGGGKAPNCVNRDNAAKDSADNGCWGFRGVANTGSGGGGASNAQFGGDGGSGVVILRYSLVAQATLTVSPTTTTYGATQTLSTSGGTGSGAVTYTVSDSGTALCSVSGSTLSFTAAGTCKVTAAKAAAGGYLPTTTLATTVTVGTASMGTVSTPTVTATAGVMNSISVDWSAVSNADTYTVRLFNSAGTTQLAQKTVSSGTSTTITTSDYASISSAQNYKVSVSASSSTGNYSAGAQSTQVAVTTNSTYTVTYTYNGATSGNGTATSSFITGGSAVTLPTPTKTGYTFNGWYESSSFTGTVLGSTYTPTSSVTLYAKWTVIVCSPTTTTANGYTVYSFTATGTCDWTVPNGVTDVQALVVAGGGGGGYAWDNQGGGGGAGGQALTGDLTLGSTVTLTVGAGGAGGFDTSGSGHRGATGGNSTISSISALGGTGGCGSRYTCANSGMPATASAAATGGNGGPQPAQGGGGSLITGSTTTGRTGGAGTSNSYRGSAVTYGVGGTGGSGQYPNSSIVGAAGAANTGNGGGGGSAMNSSESNVKAPGGAGGTGLIVLRVPNTYTLTYDYSNASSGTPSATSGTYTTAGTAITLPTQNTLARPGYTFNGWSTTSNDAATKITNSGSYTVSADTTLYSLWTINNYTVTYSTQGSTSGSAPTDSTNYNIGNTVTIKANSGTLARTGYTFAGWTLTSDGSGTVYQPAGTYTVATSNLTFYPKWTANSNTVTYGSNGGTGSMANQSITTDTATALSANTFVRQGYMFSTWNTVALGGGSSYTDGQSVTITGPMNLYAQWTANTNTVTFNNNGGSGTMANKSIVTDQATALTSNSFTRSGYTFTGWNTAANGSGTSYSNSQTVTVNSSITLYAQWANNLMAYEPFTGTASANMAGGAGSGSSGLSGNWTLVKAEKQGSALAVSHSYTSVPSLALPSNTSFTLPASNTAAHGTDWNLSYTAKALSTPISFDSAGTYYYSFINHIPVTSGYHGFGMLGLLSGLPTSTTDTAPWSLLTGSAYGSLFAIDYGNANRAAWVDGQTRGTTATYSAVGTKSSAPTTASTANFVVVRVVTSSSGNDQVSLRAFAPTETLPVDPSSITWDVQYETAITGTARYLGVQTEWYGAFDEFRIGYTYDAVTGTLPVYTITYSYDSATGGNSTTSANYISGKTALTLPTPTKTGYTFGGWYSESAFTNQVGLGGASYSPSATGTLYAKWTKNSNTVTFSPNGGTGSAATQSILTDTSTALTSNSFTRLGYLFSSWNTIALGGGTSYTDGQSVTINGPINLYAQWTANTNTVTFDNNGGSGTMSNQSITTGQSTALSSNTFTRTGYTFAGWNTAANGTGTSYTNAQSVSLTSGLSLYAQWTGAIYTVTYNYNSATGGNSTLSSNFTNGGTAVTLPTPTKTGYTFAGWYESSSFIGSALGSTYSPTTSVTIYAKWTAVTYTVTWDSNGGSTVTGTSSFVVSDTVAMPTSPTKTGKYFAGWSTTETANQGDVANKISSWPYTPSAANLTLYAIWFDDNSFSLGGSAAASARVGANSTSVNVVPKDSSFTWEAWIYPTGIAGSSFPKWGSVLDNGDSGDNYGRTWLQIMDTGSGPYLSGAYWAAASQGAAAQTNANTITMNKWQHVAMTVTRSATSCSTNGTVYVALYIDGVKIVEGSDTAFIGCTSSTGLIVGDNYDDASQFFKGKIDQVKIWDGNLTEAEIAASRSTYSNSGVDNTLRAHYDFNDLGSTPALGDVVDNVASAATTYNLSIFGASSADVTNNVSRSTNQFQITYDANTATSGTTTSQSSLNPYTALSTPGAGDLVRTGYAFGGWNTSTTGSGINFLASSTYTLLYGDQTLYSNWTANTNTVTFDANGGSGTMANQSITSGTATALTANTFTKTGYTFAGWATTSTGAVVYANSASVTITSGMDLYAKWTADSNVVVFNNNGGSGTMANQSITTDSATALTANSFSRTGYTFAGWATTSGGSVAYANSESVTLTAGMTLYAKWTANTNTVTYSSNGGSGTMANQSITTAVSTALSTNTFTRQGYMFSTWDTVALGGGASYTDGQSVTITGPINLYAQWTAGTNTVTFNNNGGTGTMANQTITSDVATALTAHSFTKTGYTFAGWSTTSGGNVAYANSASVTITTGMTLYAKWTAVSNTVTFSANGGTGTMANQSVTTDVTTALTANSFTRTGYTFAGWATTSGGNVVYANSASVTLTGGLSLYAKWTAVSNTVTFNANGGTGTMTNQSIISDAATALTANAFTKTGYTFAGWATSAGGAVAHANSASVTITTGMDLYAKWTANSNTVTFDANGGSGTMSSQSITSDVATALTANTFTKTGYSFAGWATSASGSVVHANSASVTLTGGLSLYAKWTAVSNTVTFNANGGSGTMANQSITSDAATALNANAFTKTGYTFAGWATSAGGSVVHANSASVTITAGMDLYAKWTANTNTVTFNANGGSGTMTNQSITSDAATALTANAFTKTGYTFAGWATSAGGSVVHANSALVTITSGMDLYAKWTANTYTVTYDYNSATGSNTTVSDNYTVDATTITLPVPTKTGYTFNGWYASSSFTGSAIGSTYSPTSSLTIYAKWTANTYTIAFNYNGATGSNTTLSDTYTVDGTAMSLPVPTKTGYSFAGWFASSSFTGNALGSTYSPAASGTIYAKWTAGTNTIAFDSNGGTGSMASLSVTSDVSTALTSNAFSKTGYTFAGWATSAGGSVVYADGASVSTATGFTLYAKWTANTYTVTYNYNGADGANSTATSNYTVDATAINLPVPTKTGYAFAGWYESSSFTGSALSTTYAPTSSRTIYAKWTGNANTVTFNANDGSGTPATSTQSVVSGVTTNLSANTFTRTGYTFARWTTVADGTGNGYINQDQVTLTGNLTLYAQWEGNTYTVSYDYDNATGSNADATGSYTVGGTALTLPVPTRTGYTFAGWYETANFSGSALSSTYSPASSRTIYAKWNQIMCAPIISTALGYTVYTFSNLGTCEWSVPNGVSTVQALVVAGGGGGGYSWDSTGAGGGAGGQVKTGTLSLGSSVTVNVGQGGAGGVNAARNGTGGQSSSVANISALGGTGGCSGRATCANSGTPATANAAAIGGSGGSGGQSGKGGGGSNTTGSVTNSTTGGAGVSSSYSGLAVIYGAGGAGGTNRSGLTNIPGAAGPANSGRGGGGASAMGASGPVNGGTGGSGLVILRVANTYAVNYDSSNADSGAPSATSTNYTTDATPITLPTQNTLTRAGYTFAGWSTTQNDSATRVTNSGSYTVSSNSTLYALWTAINYSVTYSSLNSDAGTVPTDSTNYNIGNTVAIQANTGNLSRTGYTFGGWVLNSDGSGTVYQSGGSYTIGTSSITLYPKWIANTYTVTYNANGASGSPSRSSDSYTSGTSGLSLPNVGTMLKTGYDFVGWSASPTGSALIGAYTTSSNVTLYAVWTLKQINYTYHRGNAGGTNVTGSHAATSPNLNAQVGLFGSVINLDSTISRNISVNSASYQFMGWNDGNSIFAPNDAYTLGESARIFTAEWVRIFEVRYGLNGGTGIIDVDPECTQGSNTCLDGQNITLSDAPTRAGYTFAGWKDQSGQLKNAGASTSVAASSYLYYAQWDAIDYTISFNSAGGSDDHVDQIKNIGDSLLMPNPGTKAGHTFAGWFGGSGNTLGAGAAYTVGASGKTFVALWTPQVYTVSYNWNGGLGAATNNASYTYGTTAITLPTGSGHSRDGYDFTGWATTPGGAPVGSTFVPTQDTMLYAVWADGHYAVNLNAHGGSVSQSSFSVPRGDDITLPTPTRAGFVFDGWFESVSSSTRVGQGQSAFTPAASRTLHAKWVQNSLYGINPVHINSLTSITVTGSHSWSGTHSASGTGAALNIPNGALASGTQVQVSFVEDLTRPRDLIDDTYAYYTSVVLHWLSGSGDNATVPVTATDKPLTLTLTNPAILPGAKVFMILNGVATEVAEATQEGEVTISVTQDPEFVIAATPPRSPASVTATQVTNSAATVSWTAPVSTGGSLITGYTVTASPGGATCVTTTELSCEIGGLSSGVSYSYSVVAENALGSSVVRSTTIAYVAPPVFVPPINVAPAGNSGAGTGTSDSLTITRSEAVEDDASEASIKESENVDPASPQADSDIKAQENQATEVETQTNLTGYATAGGLLLLFVLALVMYFILRARKRANP